MKIEITVQEQLDVEELQKVSQRSAELIQERDDLGAEKKEIVSTLGKKIKAINQTLTFLSQETLTRCRAVNVVVEKRYNWDKKVVEFVNDDGVVIQVTEMTAEERQMQFPFTETFLLEEGKPQDENQESEENGDSESDLQEVNEENEEISPEQNDEEEVKKTTRKAKRKK